MARYILIDNGSGYIYGDSADHEGKIWNGDYIDANGDRANDDTPIGFARALDESLGEHGREYEDVSRSALASNETGYHVYRADVGGSDAVAIIWDGQDRETIESVVQDCEYVTTLRTTDAA